MKITESRLRKIIRHVLTENERSKRRSLGRYKTQAPQGWAAFKTPIHQAQGQRMGDAEDDGYDSIMGFDESDEIEEEELEEGDPPKPKGCS